MNDERRVGETDHAPLRPDDVLAQAIARLPEATPQQDLWPGVLERIATDPRSGQALKPSSPQALPGRLTVTWWQLATAASLLMAVSSGLTWLAVRPAVGPTEPVVRAVSEPVGTPAGEVRPANFADAVYDAAVADLERVLREERARLDPRTVIVIERNLRTIDAAITEARRALAADPADPYLNWHLADARRRKLELLRRATELPTAGGD